MVRDALATAPNNGYSANVKIELLLNGFVLPVAQLARDFLILRAPAQHDSAEAEVVLTVDQEEMRWRVWLPDGLNTHQERVRLEKIKRKE